MIKRHSILGLTELAALLSAGAGGVLAWLTDRDRHLAIVHAGLQGGLDNWPGNTAVAAVMLAAAVYFGVAVLGLARARRRSNGSPARALGFAAAQAACGTCSLLITVMLAWMSGVFGEAMPPTMVIVFSATVLFVVGAYIGRVPPNRFVGVRNSWTRASRLAFDRANRLAGKMLIATALTGLLACAVSLTVAMTVLGTGFALTFAGSFFESWRVWRLDPDKVA